MTLGQIRIDRAAAVGVCFPDCQGRAEGARKQMVKHQLKFTLGESKWRLFEVKGEEEWRIYDVLTCERRIISYLYL